MNENVNYLAVGAFLLLALATLTGLLVWLGGEGSGQETARYRLVFEEDVTGLTDGSDVLFMGVKVGSVRRVGLVPGSRGQIEVLIDVAADTPVTTTTLGRLTQQGLTGLAAVNLSAGADGRPLATATDGKVPTIATERGGLAALFDDAPQLLSRAIALLDEANDLLGTDNRLALRRTLANVEVLSEELAVHRDELGALPGELRATLADTRGMLAEARAAVAELRPPLSRAVADLGDSAASLRRTTAKLDGWTADNDEQIAAFLDRGLGQLPELLAETRRTVRDLEKLLGSLEDDPSQVIFQPRQQPVETGQ